MVGKLNAYPKVWSLIKDFGLSGFLRLMSGIAFLMVARSIGPSDFFVLHQALITFIAAIASGAVIPLLAKAQNDQARKYSLMNAGAFLSLLCAPVYILVGLLLGAHETVAQASLGACASSCLSLSLICSQSLICDQRKELGLLLISVASFGTIGWLLLHPGEINERQALYAWCIGFLLECVVIAKVAGIGRALKSMNKPEKKLWKNMGALSFIAALGLAGAVLDMQLMRLEGPSTLALYAYGTKVLSAGSTVLTTVFAIWATGQVLYGMTSLRRQSLKIAIAGCSILGGASIACIWFIPGFVVEDPQQAAKAVMFALAAAPYFILTTLSSFYSRIAMTRKFIGRLIGISAASLALKATLEIPLFYLFGVEGVIAGMTLVAIAHIGYLLSIVHEMKRKGELKGSLNKVG